MIKEAEGYEAGVVTMTDGSSMHIKEYWDHVVEKTGSNVMANLVVKEIANQVSQRCASMAYNLVLKTAGVLDEVQQ